MSDVLYYRFGLVMMYESWAELSKYDRSCLRMFMERVVPWAARGDVLDYGCGGQPYADLIREWGVYHPYDRPEFPDSHVVDPVGEPFPLDRTWDTIVCNEVISLVDEPFGKISEFYWALAPGQGRIILTYKSSWIQYNERDRWRFTKNGMDHMLKLFGFKVEVHEELSGVSLATDYRLTMGYGVVARAV